MEDLGQGVRRRKQFDVIDKAALMEEHRKVLGNKYIDMMVDMEMDDVKAKLEELRETTEGTEDQKTLAVLSLMWMVKRRKEEGWEESREREEAEQREVHRKREMEEAESGQGDCGKMDMPELKRKREELAVLMDSRFKKAADRARLEREGDRIMEAEARHEEKRRELEEEKRAKEIWKKWEDRQRLEREGDEIVEAIGQHERREEEIQRAEEEEKVKRIEKAVAEIVEVSVECWHKMEEEK